MLFTFVTFAVVIAILGLILAFSFLAMFDSVSRTRKVVYPVMAALCTAGSIKLGIQAESVWGLSFTSSVSLMFFALAISALTLYTLAGHGMQRIADGYYSSDEDEEDDE